MDMNKDVGTQDPLHMLGSVLMDLFDKFDSALRNTSGWGYLFSVCGAFVAAVWGNFFGFLTVLLAVTMLADWLLGRWQAYRLCEYDAAVAHRGVITKATGYGLILVVWVFESRAYQELGWFNDSGGLVGTVLLMLFLIDELDSVEKNRIKLGAQPIPLWSTAIQYLRGAATRIVPQAPGPMPNPGEPIARTPEPNNEEE